MSDKDKLWFGHMTLLIGGICGSALTLVAITIVMALMGTRCV